MRWEAAAFAGMAFALATACAVSPTGASSSSDPTSGTVVEAQTSAAGAPKGRFLTPEETPDLTAILPSRSEVLSADSVDSAYFLKTRALEGSDRWALAIHDDDYSQAAIMANYSCAIGVELTPDNAPLTSQLVAMASTDAAMASDVAKEHFERPRPFLSNEGPICLERSARLEASFDYPSGHSSAGWMAGLVLAELAPDRATEVLARAGAYAESRAICGVHNRSSTIAGHTVGSAVFAALQGHSEFVAAATRARAELDAVRRSGERPAPASCAIEKRLIAREPPHDTDAPPSGR